MSMRVQVALVMLASLQNYASPPFYIKLESTADMDSQITDLNLTISVDLPGYKSCHRTNNKLCTYTLSVIVVQPVKPIIFSHIHT